MLEISRKWGMLALALATAGAIAAPMALRPAQAYADDGIEVVQEGEQGQVERGRGSFDDTPVVNYVAADGTQGSAECNVLDDQAATPIEGGWWLLDHQSVAKDKVIEVTGDAHFVCSGPIDFVTGHIHVAEGAHLSLYAEQGHEDTTSITTSRYKWGAILGDGEVSDCAFDVFEGHQVKFRDENGSTHRWAPTQFECNLGTFNEEYATLNSAWYFVTRDNTIEHRIDVAGHARIVLCPGATLTCTGGIHVPSGMALTIYGIDENPGKLVADAVNERLCAGIGGNDNEGCGVVTICGGEVEATSGVDAAGIGGGEDGCAGRTIIRGGKVFARSSEFGAGIGCGQCGHGGSVEIAGGTVTAMGGEDSAGIGGGEDGSIDRVTISNGNVTAVGKCNGAGIGGGEDSNSGTITISGGDVNATGGENGAGIGGGCAGNGDTIQISGGKVQATHEDGAGIGGGEKGNASTITISGGEVNTSYVGEGKGAGIGGGNDVKAAGSITISGGKVTSTSNHGAGIGGGVYEDTSKKDGGYTTNITGGVVRAAADHGVGIGAGVSTTDLEPVDLGCMSCAGDISIGGIANVTATGYKAGIGGVGGTLTVKGGTTTVIGGERDGSGGIRFCTTKPSGNSIQVVYHGEVKVYGGTLHVQTSSLLCTQWFSFRYGAAIDAAQYCFEGGTVEVESAGPCITAPFGFVAKGPGTMLRLKSDQGMAVDKGDDLENYKDESIGVEDGASFEASSAKATDILFYKPGDGIVMKAGSSKEEATERATNAKGFVVPEKEFTYVYMGPADK